MRDEVEKIIGFPHPPQKHGGPGSFQTRLEEALKERDWQVVYPEDDILPNVILIVGGTKKHRWLKKCKKQGTRIVHRLDGMNWLHRVKKVPLKEKLLCEIRNRMTAKIRRKFADHVIYQSEFVKTWWERLEGPVVCETSVIHNAVSLDNFKPAEFDEKKFKVICLEGNIDYTPYALEMLNFLSTELKEKDINLNVYGSLENNSLKKYYPEINLLGSIPREEVRKAYNNCLYLSLDINAACPNTVIEALASGCPVVGYNTGALKELVGETAGEIIKYDGNSWEIETPDFQSLVEPIIKIRNNFEQYSSEARKLAESKYCINDLVEKYLMILERKNEPI